MQNKIFREKAIELISKIRDVIKKDIDLSDYFGSDFMVCNEEEVELETDIQGVSNGFLAEIICAVTGYNFEVCGEGEKMYPCPCCGFKTLTEIYNLTEGTGYEICPYCGWEDDGTIDPKVYRSINKGSMNDYRKNMQTKSNKYYINKWYKE